MLVVLLVTACTGESAPQSAAPAPSPPRWQLEWADEFDGSALSADRWAVEDHSTFGDGNNELACLLDRPENVRVAGGHLRLRAVREPVPVPCGTHDTRFPGGRSYTSAMISTRGRSDWRYGRFEVRARLPTQAATSQGLWPAFWLRPTGGGDGELDVVEAIGSPATSGPSTDESHRVHQTIWFDYQNTRPRQARSVTVPAGPAAGFHVYAVTWEPGSIRWYVDGARTYVRDRATTPWLDEAFGRPFFLRLNLAVGGGWPGAPDASTAFPADFLVDWVRVYQRSTGPTG